MKKKQFFSKPAFSQILFYLKKPCVFWETQACSAEKNWVFQKTQVCKIFVQISSHTCSAFYCAGRDNSSSEIKNFHLVLCIVHLFLLKRKRKASLLQKQKEKWMWVKRKCHFVTKTIDEWPKELKQIQESWQYLFHTENLVTLIISFPT